ncbi:MAG: hypothetical protein AAFX05_00485 [Planctomycetota bacterium]
MLRLLACLALAVSMTACLGYSLVRKTESIGPRNVEVLRVQTIDNIGAGQGIYHDRDAGLIYLYGDADPGIVREYRVEGDARPKLVATGRSIALTRGGEDIIPHPTGLTRAGGLTFIGDTVRQQGVIWAIDWDRALADGTLDNAILNQVVDDTAFNGTRPEFVMYDGHAYVATSDYGNAGNEVRLLDPERLMTASRTSADGVILARYRCGPYVQTLHWLHDQQQLVLVQNQQPGRLYRLTFVRMPGADPNAPNDLRVYQPLDIEGIEDELEGFALLDGESGLAITFSAMREDNVRFIRLW